MPCTGAAHRTAGRPGPPDRGDDEGARALLGDALATGAAAAVLGGIPSTLVALARGRDPLEAALAAGSLAVGCDRRRSALLVAAVPVHLGVSLAWALVLARALPRRGTALAGAAAGLAIAAFDLGVVGRRASRIRALPLGPQLADHAAYGAIVGALLARRRAARRPG